MQQERVKIATISFASEDENNSSCYLKISFFIGKSPVNEDYIKDGDSYRIFQTTGEAVEYASTQFHCDYIVVDNARENRHCEIQALIGKNPFFSAPPFVYSLCK